MAVDRVHEFVDQVHGTRVIIDCRMDDMDLIKRNGMHDLIAIEDQVMDG
jgi:hypothetical protein